MRILGIGGIGSDPACSLIVDGVLVAAIEEQKLSRRRRQTPLPDEALDEVLRIAGLNGSDIDALGISRPLPASTAAEIYATLEDRFPNCRIVLFDHHHAHAASAYYSSPFSSAKVLTLDRRGDVRCGAIWEGKGNDLAISDEWYVPNSLGELFSRVTELLGFNEDSDEHKVQWLSSQGSDQFVEAFQKIVTFDARGLPRVDLSWFEADRDERGGFGSKFEQTIGVPLNKLTGQATADLALAMQRTLEACLLRIVGNRTPLCLAGGIGLNALPASALERSLGPGNVFVQPASGNAGTALGAALLAWHQTYGRAERVDMRGYCVGPSYSPEQIKQVLENCKLRFRVFSTSDEAIESAVDHLADSRIVAWMQERMEFGPRALGNRSILASPLDDYAAENLNTFIKHRELFRKFAASVPSEDAANYFETSPNARYLTTVGTVRPEWRERFKSAILSRDQIRVHVVHREDNPAYWRLLKRVGERSGLPVLYNTSFNLFGEPLVCTPRDAVRSFYSSGVDALVIGNFLLEK